MWKNWRCILNTHEIGIKSVIDFLSSYRGIIQDVFIWSPANIAHPNAQMLVEAMSQCRRLQRLRLALPQQAADAFIDATFTSTLEDYGSDFGGAEGSSFFTRHPNLRSLEIKDALRRSRDEGLEISSLLPRLRKVRVTQIMPLSILRGNSVSDLRVDCWRDWWGADVPAILSAIHTSSVPLQRLTVHMPEVHAGLPWYTDLIAHLPDLNFLSLWDEFPEMDRDRVNVLATLPRLETLYLGWYPYSTGYTDAEYRNPRYLNAIWQDIPEMLKICKALKRLEMCAHNDQHKRYQRVSSVDEWVISDVECVSFFPLIAVCSVIFLTVRPLEQM